MTPTDLQRLNEELRAEVAQLDLAQLTAGGWDERQRILAEQIRRAPASRFLRWPTMRQIRILSRREGEARRYLAELRARPDWATRYALGVEECGAGAPVYLPAHPSASANSILHAHHVARWEDASHARVDELQLIVEFGGGYGGMCRTLRSLGFRGRYVIYDLPVMSALQRYYVQTAGLSLENIACVSTLEGLAAQIEAAGPGRALFLATWSLSEMPFALRESLSPFWPRFTDYLIAYQLAFAGMDNRAYFRRFAANPSLREVSWVEAPITTQPFNYHLLGFPNRNCQAVALRGWPATTPTERLVGRVWRALGRPTRLAG